MKKLLMLGVLVAVCGLAGVSRGATADPADRFLDAYFLIQEGDAATKQGDWTKAAARFKATLEVLADIKAKNPEWNPHIIEYRTKYCTDQITDLQPKLATVPPVAVPEKPAVPAPAVPAIVVAPPPMPAPVVSAEDLEKLKQAQAELARAQDQIRQLQAARDEANAKLQDALKKSAPADMTPQLEALIKQNKELAAQYATSQTEIVTLRERIAAKPAPVPVVTPAPAPAPAPVVVARPGDAAEMTSLRLELIEARAQIRIIKQDLDAARLELAQTKTELGQTKQTLASTTQELGAARSDLYKALAENKDLRTKYDHVVAQLTDSNRKLTAAQASAEKDDQIIRELRKANAALRLTATRETITPQAGPENIAASNAPTIPELKGWTPRHWNKTAKDTKPVKGTVPVEDPNRSKFVAELRAPVSAPVQSAPSASHANTINLRMDSTPSDWPPLILTGSNIVGVKAKPGTAAKPAAPAGPTETETLLKEASESLAKNDYDTAVAKYDKLLVKDPKNLTALSNVGTIRLRQNKIDEAQTYLKRAVAVAPNSCAAEALLGVTYLRKGQWDQAKTSLTRAIKLDAKNAEAHNFYAIVLDKENKLADAQKSVQKALELNPNYADAHFNLAVLYLKEKPAKTDMARVEYQKARNLGASADAQMEAALTPPAPAPAPAPAAPPAEPAPPK